MAVVGALTIAFSSILVRLADVVAVDRRDLPLRLRAAAAGRCSPGARTGGSARGRARTRRSPRGAGVFFAADLICWHHAIDDVGAGLATVLGNLQVAFVPLVAWLALGERPGAACWPTLPLVLSGVVLISGVLEDGAYGDNPRAGRALRRSRPA